MLHKTFGAVHMYTGIEGVRIEFYIGKFFVNQGLTVMKEDNVLTQYGESLLLENRYAQGIQTSVVVSRSG